MASLYQISYVTVEKSHALIYYFNTQIKFPTATSEVLDFIVSSE